MPRTENKIASLRENVRPQKSYTGNIRLQESPVFLWERRMLANNVWEEKNPFGYIRVREFTRYLLTNSLSVPVIPCIITFCYAVSPARYNQSDSTGVQCWGQEEGPGAGHSGAHGLKETYQDNRSKKPVCFLLSEWQAVLNNVNNKLFRLTKKNIFVGLGSKQLLQLILSFNNVNVSFNLAYFYCFPFSKRILCGSWLRELTLCLYFKSQCIRQLV